MQTIVSGAYRLVPSVEFSSFANHKKHCDPRIIIVSGSVCWLVEQDLRKQFSSIANDENGVTPMNLFEMSPIVYEGG